MNILVAVDLSPVSDRVIAAAERVAQASAAAVYVLHVAEPDPDFVGYGAGPQVVREQVAELHHREHRAVQALAERQIGTASCRERVCQYASISVVAVSLQTTNNNI